MSVHSATPLTPAGVMRRSSSSSYWGRLDWVLLVAALILTGYGSLLVWSASLHDMASPTDSTSFVKKHMLNVGIGIVLGFLVSRLNYRSIRAYTPVIYIVSFVGILLTFIPGIGFSIAGARAWIKLPMGFTLQPSELMKIAMILAMAMILSEKRDSESEPKDRDVLTALLVAGVPMVVVLGQNDTGTVLMMGTAVIAIIAVSGARTRWVAGLISTAVIGGLIAIQFLLQQYQRDRILSFLDPSSSPGSAAYNATQARIAIGGGGIFGQGLFHGAQTQSGFVPVNESDFVFTVAGEELGLIGAGFLLLLVAIILWRGIRIAMTADDMFGRLVATGIVAWLTFQTFENIGMALGIMPVTGVPLPFVSYGGTSMFASWIAIGLLQNVWMHRPDRPGG